jgi:transposase
MAVGEWGGMTDGVVQMFGSANWLVWVRQIGPWSFQAPLPVMNKRIYVGLDVHARSVKGCAIDRDTGGFLRQNLAANEAGITEWVSGLPGPVMVVYEAGPAGFGLARCLAASRIECLVAAPSELQPPPGDRVKTDARDAEHLARLALLGQITPVRVPGHADEAARDLVRAREEVRADLMRARHRISKLLLRHGLVE